MLKRGIAVIVAIIILVSQCGINVMADTPALNPPSVGSASAILIDAQTGEILYAKNEHVKRFPASITKIMTCLLALEKATATENGLQTVVTADAATLNIEPGSSHSSIQLGEQLTVEQLLYFAMVVSGNDAANALGQYVCDGDLEAFSQLMTTRAAELGCQETFFWNAHGLNEAPEAEDKHMTSAYDMAQIMKQAVSIPKFVELISTEYYETAPTNKFNHTRRYTNTNKLILSDNEEYYEYCVGGKTGWTTPAGNTLVTYAEKDGRKLICVVLKANGRQVAYEDTRNLYDYGFSDSNFNLVSLADVQPATALSKTVSVTKDGKTVGSAEISLDTTQALYVPAGFDPAQLTYELTCADAFEEGTEPVVQVTAKVPTEWVVNGYGAETIVLQANVGEVTYLPVATEKPANDVTPTSSNNGQTVKDDGISVGTYILFAVIAIIIVVAVLFGIRYWNWKKRRKKKYWWKEYL